MLGKLMRLLIYIICLAFFTSMAEVATASGQRRPLAAREQAALAREVRRELAALPFYDVFDWLEAEARADGTVRLRGQVVRPTTRSDAEARVRALRGVKRVVNEIELLPVSPSDERLRVALYRALYGFDAPLFRYATQPVPPAHIIVRNGRAALKGFVATEGERAAADAAARSVPGLFEVSNELRVEAGAAR